MTERREVVVTGLGAVTPSGLDAASTWDAVVNGRSAVTRLDAPEFVGLPVRIGGLVRGFDPAVGIEPRLARRLDPVQHWALVAADEALAHAGVAADPALLPWDAERFGVVVATGSGPVDAMQAATRTLDARGPRAVPGTLSMHGAPDAAAALISQRRGARGSSHAVCATCASGAVGIGEAMRRIRHGYADAVLVVGMEDCLGPVNLASNANLRALATGFEDAPTTASRPFDRGRTGFVMAQGAAATLLEAADAARARDAAPLARVIGFGASSDAHHATAPHPEGRGAARAITDCLADAGVDTAEVAHVNAHGTGTPLGDAAEIAAFERALGPDARRIPVTATKSSTGHLLGASGVVEALIAIETMRTGLVPPTINLDDPAFEGWDIVAGTARAADVPTVLSTSFGFGGHNGALLFARADGKETA
ncbi:beta-ketoacyl-[acyl-carrier-protein] synthase family protein [Pseudoclavibacter chungangensis]|uniref:Beta-ketoacyl-[acyl-carrier-protein] synthase family protein n=1 Tax=Pseudoclavibacter chungangensis TaxID=587635 RepID=A0A7J5BLY3_9MICO|nr:beta-ketoacyl-[acyl-carrier-protein] synthase family protein [Pseudoclavibacter chungangensis]KAB1651916.1 beta-ketoacyl-[acyl-carrier-protein] synthase family protein [Pseudoclavibacter chungangensis]NYJ66887.1 3-oxoacyl-[acyl-carrier-protein] synthase II [Pseudoclavibacter chungangensis]